jgi:hypothetical protein
MAAPWNGYPVEADDYCAIDVGSDFDFQRLSRPVDQQPVIQTQSANATEEVAQPVIQTEAVCGVEDVAQPVILTQTAYGVEDVAQPVIQTQTAAKKKPKSPPGPPPGWVAHSKWGKLPRQPRATAGASSYGPLSARTEGEADFGSLEAGLATSVTVKEEEEEEDWMEAKDFGSLEAGLATSVTVKEEEEEEDWMEAESDHADLDIEAQMSYRDVTWRDLEARAVRRYILKTNAAANELLRVGRASSRAGYSGVSVAAQAHFAISRGLISRRATN